MRDRRGAGRRGLRARLGRWIVAAMAAAALAVPSSSMRAEGRLRPLDQHAAVLNQGIVGSAFLLSDRLAVTNRHVVAGLSPGDTVELVAADGRVRAAGRLLAVSPRMDLALLEAPAGFLPPVPAADAAGVAGMQVVAAGIDAADGRIGAAPRGRRRRHRAAGRDRRLRAGADRDAAGRAPRLLGRAAARPAGAARRDGDGAPPGPERPGRAERRLRRRRRRRGRGLCAPRRSDPRRGPPAPRALTAGAFRPPRFGCQMRRHGDA